MASITTRAGKGSPLTNNEVDANFTNLNTDKAETDGATLTNVDINSGTIDGVTIGGASAGAVTATTITGTSFVSSGDMSFGDNDKAIFGAGSDLEIYHDGTDTYITESGGGSLIIKGNFLQLQSPQGEMFINNVANGAVTAYYDNAAKLATTATGIDVTGTVTADGLTATGDMNIDSGTLFVDASANAVGFGTTSPTYKVQAGKTSTGAGDQIAITSLRAAGSTATPNNMDLDFLGFDDQVRARIRAIDKSFNSLDSFLSFSVSNPLAEAMRIDSSGNLLVSTTQPAQAGNTSDAAAGIALLADNSYQQSRSGVNMYLNRLGSNGDIAVFRIDGSTVGSIGYSGRPYLAGNNGSTGGGLYFGSSIFPTDRLGTANDNTNDLGGATFRFDDIYATNGTIQTSDRNEKQDIEELTEAEQRVAVAAKSLLRKFRWKDAVEEKGDDARIHFGIIAQDLQAAFEAEGLDAGRYAMFIYSEWWETYTDVPAVEAVDAVYETVTDEEGNETQVLVSEAVEAKEAYTRTDTYDTEEEAPEGAVKKSRMGVRYSELLAFIIAAI